MPKYVIATCEKYNVFRHGIPDENSSDVILDHYLILDVHSDLNRLIYAINFLNRQQRYNLINPDGVHFNGRLEIVEPIILPCGEIVAIIKTFWLKIIQRWWKKKFRFQKQKITKYKNIKCLLKREICNI